MVGGKRIEEKFDHELFGWLNLFREIELTSSAAQSQIRLRWKALLGFVEDQELKESNIDPDAELKVN